MPYVCMRDGARLHYYSVGRGVERAPPVVLLHGFAMQGAMWLPFVATLAHRYRFILPDLRGFGLSHRLHITEPSVLDQHAHDLHDLLDGLGLHQVLLGGLSMGACTSLQYQRLYGFGRVRAYVHMDQGPCVRNGADWSHGVFGLDQTREFERFRPVMDQMLALRHLPYRRLPAQLRRSLPKMLSAFLGHAFHRRPWRWIRHLARVEALVRQLMPAKNWPVYLDVMRSYLHEDYDWRPSLSRIEIPMTVMVGMQSTMYPAAGQEHIAEHVPQARIVRFHNCGHAIPFEQPRRFVKELTRFLDAHGAENIVADQRRAANDMLISARIVGDS